MPAERFDFPNAKGEQLAALLDRPDGPIRAVALFAHCFTCGKDIKAARLIARGLQLRGIAVLRFDKITYAHPEQVINGAHPLRVPAGQVVIDGDDVHRPAAQCVAGRGERPGQRLALTGSHLRDLPGQQRQRAHELDVEGTLPEPAASRAVSISTP